MTHRNDDSWSAKYAAHEDLFITVGKGEGNGKLSETVYHMNKKEKVLMDNFLEGRNNMLLFAKCNVNPKTNKPTLYDPETGEPIYIGDGVIPQVERYASKYAFNKFNAGVMRTIMSTLAEKAKQPTGNHFTFICNERGWSLVQEALSDWINNNHTDGAFLWSKAANDYVKVGATYNSYTWGGNTVTFQVDRTFSREYNNEKAFFLCLDLTADKTSAEPPIAMFTLKGGDFIKNTILGVGGADGLSSGVVSSPVAASKMVYWGYSGIAVFNPYRSFIAREI